MKFLSFADKLSTITGYIAGTIVCLQVLLVLSEITARTFFSQTLYVADEYSGYMMSIFCYLSLAYTMKNKSHIRMTFLLVVLKGKAKLVLDMICQLLGVYFCAWMLYYTSIFFWDSFISGSRSITVSNTYLAIPQFFIPLGLVILMIQFLAELIRDWLSITGKIDGSIEIESSELGR